MSPPRLLNENALKEREQTIITAGISLIQHSGIENLTMDKVVAQVPYSKGTIYKHFISKEDLLLAISNYAIEVLSDLFYRAYQFKGCSRERMLLLNFSYLIYAILYPELFQAVICAKSQSVIGKSSEQRLKENDQLQVTLLTAIHGIVEDGLSDQSIVLPDHLNIQQICFANWSMAYGTIILLSGEVDSCSGRTDLIVERELFNNSNLLFDGMGWQPLTKDKKHCTELAFALQSLFPQELTLMKEKGRELNFS
jgi:AcrR family transcriptional regulator